jgi:hypothetical protein
MLFLYKNYIVFTFRACIAHHLMNSKDCFFCKATIQFVVGLGDEVLHDLSTLENSAT